jgi:hypothetical protein
MAPRGPIPRLHRSTPSCSSTSAPDTRAPLEGEESISPSSHEVVTRERSPPVPRPMRVCPWSRVLGAREQSSGHGCAKRSMPGSDLVGTTDRTGSHPGAECRARRHEAHHALVRRAENDGAHPIASGTRVLHAPVSVAWHDHAHWIAPWVGAEGTVMLGGSCRGARHRGPACGADHVNVLRTWHHGAEVFTPGHDSRGTRAGSRPLRCSHHRTPWSPARCSMVPGASLKGVAQGNPRHDADRVIIPTEGHDGHARITRRPALVRPWHRSEETMAPPTATAGTSRSSPRFLAATA